MHAVQKIFALTMIMPLLFVQFAFAQDDTSAGDQSAQPAQSAPSTAPAQSDPTAAASTPADTSTPSAPDAPAPDTSDTSTNAASPAQQTTPESDAVNPQGDGSASVQDTFNGQSTVSADALESTADPQAATSSPDDATQVTVTATSTDATSTANQTLLLTDASSSVPDSVLPIDTGTSTADVVAQNIDPNSDTDSGSVVTQDPTESDTQVLPQPAPIPTAALTPSPEYSFALTGNVIPAITYEKNSDGTITQGEVSPADTLPPILNNASGTATVTGQCSAAYYVVLLFKNATDYIDDPNAYLVNRAYPCTGTFAYSISQLPYNLPSGNYYLMVGQEGDTGSWTPITAVSEITITKNQQTQ